MGLDYLLNDCTLNINQAFVYTDLEGNRKGLYTELFFVFFIHFILQLLHTFRYKSRSTFNRPQQQPLQQSVSQPVPNNQQHEIREPSMERDKATQQEQQNKQNDEEKVEKVQQIEVTDRKMSIAKESEKRKSVVRQSVSENINEGDPRPQLPWHDKRWNRNFSVIFSTHSVALGMVILFSPLAGGLVVAYLHLLCFIIYTVCEARKVLFVGKIMRTVMDLLNLTLLIIGTVGINYNQYKDDTTICLRSFAS